MFKTFYRGNADFSGRFMPGPDGINEESWSDEEDEEEESAEAEYGGEADDGQRRRFKVNQLAKEFEEDF